MKLFLSCIISVVGFLGFRHFDFTEAGFLTDVCMGDVDEGSPCKEAGQSKLQYAFSRDLEKCVQFNYTGCGGNRNRFKHRFNCYDSCEIDYQLKKNKFMGADMKHKKVPDDCKDPLQPGTCLAMLTQWYYNAHSKKCEKFVFGGCDGNKNRFETEDQCIWVCIEKNVY